MEERVALENTKFPTSAFNATLLSWAYVKKLTKVFRIKERPSKRAIATHDEVGYKAGKALYEA